MFPEKWYGCVGTIQELEQEHLSDNLPIGEYQIMIHTMNGWSCDLFTAQLVIVSSFIRKGDWKIFNGFINNQECTLGTPGFHGRVTIRNEPHNSGIKE